MNDSFLFDITSSMGEHERKVASARVKANKISMARQGLNSSGSVPFGYVRNPQSKKLEVETMIIKDDEGFKQEVESPKANIVRMIYQWYLDGDGQRTICDKLNGMGIKNNQGNQWVPNSIRYMLTCPTYKGTLVAHTYENFKGKMKIDDDQTVVKDGNHPAIIDPEIWDKAQKKRDIKNERSGTEKRSKDWNSKKNMSILDGLVFCGCESCGRKSTIKWYPSRNNFYIIKCTRFNSDGIECSNGGSNIKDIEKIVFEDILKEKEKIEEKITTFSSDDFGIRTEELEDQKRMYQDSLNDLELEMNVIYKMEMKYEMEKEIKQKEDKAKEMMIAESKAENDEKRNFVQMKLNEVIKNLQATPSADEEIKLLNERLDIINELQINKDLTKTQVNAMLKQIILKVNYKRELPPNYRSLSMAEREKFDAVIEVEFLK
jgi:site-specific DNA recombinase